MAVRSLMVPLGTPLPEFSLPTIDALVEGTSTVMSSDDFRNSPALLVIFLCNHCPYVRHIENKLGELLDNVHGLGVVGICSNDTDSYPEDGPAGLMEQRTRAGWTFPYLFDEPQNVAHAFQAAATPDFFLYGSDRKLAYRGAFDESTPRNEKPVTGELLSAAIKQVLAGEPVPEPHIPSMGCSIKYRR